jgi:hypothetical protein
MPYVPSPRGKRHGMQFIPQRAASLTPAAFCSIQFLYDNGERPATPARLPAVFLLRSRLDRPKVVCRPSIQSQSEPRLDPKDFSWFVEA